MLQVRIVSVNGELFNGEAEKLSLPTPEGRITIYPGHANLVTQLDKGMLRYSASHESSSDLESMTESDSEIEIRGGIAMIEADVVTVAAE